MKLILGLSKDSNRKSTLQLALESARFHSGYKHNTCNRGQFDKKRTLQKELEFDFLKDLTDEVELFTATFLYLNCLEQIGQIFCNGSIEDAIKSFARDSMPDKDAKLIQKLRHALAHSFGLVNISPRNHTPTNKFILNWADDNTPVVIKAREEWGGNYNDKSNVTSDTINVFKLFRLVEDIIKKLQEQCKAGTLVPELDIDEIKSRYTIIS